MNKLRVRRNPNTNQTKAIKIVNADSFLSLVAQEAPNPSPNKRETIIQVVNIIIYLAVRTGFEPVSHRSGFPLANCSAS